jgi:AFG3 family protein
MTSKRKVLDRMVMALAGRVSEEIFFGDDAVGSGASDDFRKVTSWATTYVTTWGMSKRVGPVYYASNPEELQKPFSEETARIIVSSPGPSPLCVETNGFRTRKSRRLSWRHTSGRILC